MFSRLSLPGKSGLDEPRRYRWLGFVLHDYFLCGDRVGFRVAYYGADYVSSPVSSGGGASRVGVTDYCLSGAYHSLFLVSNCPRARLRSYWLYRDLLDLLHCRIAVHRNGDSASGFRSATLVPTFVSSSIWPRLQCLGRGSTASTATSADFARTAPAAGMMMVRVIW